MKQKKLVLGVAAALGGIVAVWAVFNLVSWLLITPETHSQVLPKTSVDANTPTRVAPPAPAALPPASPAVPASDTPPAPNAAAAPQAATATAPAAVSAPDAFTVIFNRKSVRKFTDKVVERKDLELILKAGMAAPTAVDRRPWAFVAVTDRAVLNALADKLPYAKMLYQATAAIVVLGDLDKTLPGEGQAYWIQDCSAVTQNILLAVEALGLGAVWTATYPGKDREAAVREVLGLPLNVIPLNVIPIGYPDGDPKPKDKWDPTIIHWEKW